MLNYVPINVFKQRTERENASGELRKIALATFATLALARAPLQYEKKRKNAVSLLSGCCLGSATSKASLSAPTVSLTVEIDSMIFIV